MAPSLAPYNVVVAAPGFAEEARRQAALLRGAPEEIEALAFIETVADTDGWTP
mgnify:CR=1 FL=1